MRLRNVKKRWTLWILMMLLIISAGCAGKTILAKPPLPNKIQLPSITVDKNDRTQQPGYWIDDFDMRNLIKYSEAIEAVRELWK